MLSNTSIVTNASTYMCMCACVCVCAQAGMDETSTWGKPQMQHRIFHIYAFGF